MENKKESKTYAVIGILTFVFIMSLFILLGQKARAQESNLPTTYKLYSWKHTGNARAADAGIPAYHRQRQNGHASMRTMEEYLKNKIGWRSEEIANSFPGLEQKNPPASAGG